MKKRKSSRRAGWRERLDAQGHTVGNIRTARLTEEEVARVGGETDEPTAASTHPELRKHVAALRDEGLSFESAHAYQEARQALADAAEGLLDEIDRLSAAPTRPTREQVRELIERIDRHCEPGHGWRRRSCPACGNLGTHADECALESVRAALIGGDHA